MSDFISNSQSSGLCTFALGQNNLIHQAVYVCATCGGEEAHKCCCAGCATTCHIGHETSFLGYGRAYCDCGAAGCNLSKSSVTAAAEVLRYSSSTNIAMDADGRLNDTSQTGLIVKPFQGFDILVGSPETVSPLNPSPDRVATTTSVYTEGFFQLFETLCISLAEKSKETFWLGANQEPSCALEVMAASVFRTHVASCSNGFDPSRSGAEFWVQVKKLSNNSNNSSSTTDSSPHKAGRSSSSETGDIAVDDDDGTEVLAAGKAAVAAAANTANEGVDLHYDKDEVTAERFGVGVFPQISTVTYVSKTNEAASTLILDSTAGCPVGMPIKRCFISHPARGKHVSFDGRFLHGAPSELSRYKKEEKVGYDGRSIEAQSTTQATEFYRVTFLVNIWLHHHPAGIQPLPSDLHSYLKEKEREIGLTFPTDLPATSYINLVPSEGHSAAAAAPIKISSKKITEENGEWLNIPFVTDTSDWGKDDEEAGIFLTIWLPNEVLQHQQQLQSAHAEGSSAAMSASTSSSQGKGKLKSAPTSTSAATSVEIVYKDEECAARLEYEVDEEAEDDLAGDVNGALDMNED